VRCTNLTWLATIACRSVCRRFPFLIPTSKGWPAHQIDEASFRRHARVRVRVHVRTHACSSTEKHCALSRIHRHACTLSLSLGNGNINVDQLMPSTSISTNKIAPCFCGTADFDWYDMTAAICYAPRFPGQIQAFLKWMSSKPSKPHANRLFRCVLANVLVSNRFPWCVEALGLQLLERACDSPCHNSL
jgi:hypothetical protein